MNELTEVEEVAVRHWKSNGLYNTVEMASKILASRHQQEHYRIYREVHGE
jgi:hypothetical protein